MKIYYKSFTFVEIMLFLLIVGILLVVLFIALKPGEIFSKIRDTSKIRDIRRVSNIESINKIILTLRTNDPYFNELNYASSQVVYLSLPDTSSTCGNWLSQLPTLPSGWSYRCSATPTNIDGTGWIPLPFSQNPLVNLSQLPLDPVNKPPYYYVFVANNNGYEININLEKDKYFMLNDNGNDLYSYELGSNKFIISGLYINNLTFSKQTSFLNFLKLTLNEGEIGYVNFIQQTYDGGYVIVGTIEYKEGSLLSKDILIVKLNSLGSILWTKRIPLLTDTGLNDIIVQQTRDGSFLVSANYDFFKIGEFLEKVSSNISLNKINSSGSPLWMIEINENTYDYINEIKEVSDHGFILLKNDSNQENYDTFNQSIVKLTSDGFISWIKKIYVEGNILSVQETSDKDYIILGESYITEEKKWNPLVIKLDSFGSLYWAKRISTKKNINIYSPLFNQTSDGNYLFLSIMPSEENLKKSNNKNINVLIYKLDPSGSLLWAKKITLEEVKNITYFDKTDDGGYIIAGEVNNFTKEKITKENHNGIFIAKINSNGSVAWAKKIGIAEDFSIHSIKQTYDKGYIILGHAESLKKYSYTDTLIIKLDFSGFPSWAKRVYLHQAKFIQQTSDGGYVIVGTISKDKDEFGPKIFDYDIFIAKLDHLGNVNNCSSILDFFPNISFVSTSVLDISHDISISDISIDLLPPEHLSLFLFFDRPISSPSLSVISRCQE